MTITADSVPALRRGVRRHFDATRDAMVLMAPERVVVLDEIADAILGECKAGCCVRDISATLAMRFQAEHQTVEADVVVFLQDLFDKGLITA